MKKDFDDFLAIQLSQVYAYYHQQNMGINEVSTLIKDKPESIKILSETLPWSMFYELPYRTFLTICILEFNLTEVVKIIAASDDQIREFLKQMAKLDDEDDTFDKYESEKLSDEEEAFRFSLIMALFNQISSIAIHTHPLCYLIERIREGNDEALFDAVLVDQSIVATPTIAHRIQTAQLQNDENFMDLLSKAIKGSRPKRDRPDKDLDDLRYLIEVVDEEIGIDNITREKLHKILAEDLELYDYESLGGFIKLIQRRNKKYRT